MIKIVLLSCTLLLTLSAKTQTISSKAKPGIQSYQYEDVFGNKYKTLANLYQDKDKDGYINLYDRHDQNPNVGYYSTPTMTDPSYYQNYKSSTYDYNKNRTVYEGERGGNYYINKNGNKTYLKNN